MYQKGRSVVFPSRYAQEAEGKRAPKARGARWSGGMLPQKIFIFRASEMPFLMFFRGNFHKSKHEKIVQLFSNLVVHTLWQPLIQCSLREKKIRRAKRASRLAMLAKHFSTLSLGSLFAG